jgi:hypothetical protein
MAANDSTRIVFVIPSDPNDPACRRSRSARQT